MKKYYLLLPMIVFTLLFTLFATGCPPAPQDTPDPVDDNPQETNAIDDTDVVVDDTDLTSPVHTADGMTGMDGGMFLSYSGGIPTDKVELLAWLQAGMSSEWAHLIRIWCIPL